MNELETSMLAAEVIARRLGTLPEEELAEGWEVQRRARFKHDPRLAPLDMWIGFCAKRRAIDLLRRRRTHTAHGRLKDVGPHSFLFKVYDPDPLHRMIVKEQLDSVTGRLTDALELWARGMGYPEISEALDMPLGTVKSDINRRRIKLRKARA